MLQRRAESPQEKASRPVPGFKFLVDGEDNVAELSYESLDRWARAIGAKLQKMGLESCRAILLYPPGLEYIAGFFGCLYANVIAVPAYPPDPTRLERTIPRLQAIIRDSQAKVILTTEEIFSMASFLSEQAPDLMELEWLATNTLNQDLAGSWRIPGISGETLAFLQYTSGSTGEPKGVMLSHANLLHNLGLIQKGFGVDATDHGVSWLPPYHDMGLIGGILEPLYLGIPIELMSPLHFLQRPLRWLKVISKYGGTASGGPNFAYELCIRKVTPEQKKDLDLSCWSVAFTGAEPILSETLERFYQAFASCGFRREAFYPCYGLAEGTLIVAGGQKDQAPQTVRVSQESLKKNFAIAVPKQEDNCFHLVGCGKSFSDQSVMIVHPEREIPCEEGEVGEIWVCGPSVAQGYWNKPELTQKTFCATLKDSGNGPFLRTGDLGFLRDAELFFTGRSKDLIIIRGYNHYPQDIERTVESCHPALRPGCGAAFSICVDHEEKLVMVQEIDEGKLRGSGEDFSQMVDQIRTAISQKHGLDLYAVILSDKGQMPKTSSGKVQRGATREGFLTGTLNVLHSYQKNSTPKKRLKTEFMGIRTDDVPEVISGKQSAQAIILWLTQRLSDHVGIDPKEIDIKRPLAHYGLDSKDAVNISGEMEDWLGFNLSPTLLWQYPTIESLADYLSQGEAHGPVND